MGSTQDLPATDSPNGDLPRRYMQRYTLDMSDMLNVMGSSHPYKDKRSFRGQHNPSQYDRTLTLTQGRSGRSYP